MVALSLTSQSVVGNKEQKMENYEIGLIFVDDEDYTNKANWCNEHNCYIEEIEPLEDGTGQFQIKQIPQKTEDEKLIEQLEKEQEASK